MVLDNMDDVMKEKRIVIVGGGVVGCCIAYYLTRHPQYDPDLHSIVIFEASNIAGASSGKAGGLVATWADPQCIAPLSFQLHSDLAKEHDGESNWGYRRVRCADVDAMGEAVGQANSELNVSHFHSHSDIKAKTATFPPELDWIRPEAVRSYTELGDPTNTAQVHPFQFTTAIAQLARSQGAEIIIGSVTEIFRNQSSAVESVAYKARETSESHLISATDIVVAAGPWTTTLLPAAPIKESRNHSIVVRPSKVISPYVLFPELHPRVPQKRIPPEIYPRPDGTVYSCGPSDEDVPLPETSDMVEVNQSVCETILKDISSVSQEIHDGELLAQQACYRPIVVGRRREMGPLIGPTHTRGLWLAAGHDSWGIQNGPASGKIIAEMILEGSSHSADAASLDPRHMLSEG